MPVSTLVESKKPIRIDRDYPEHSLNAHIETNTRELLAWNNRKKKGKVIRNLKVINWTSSTAVMPSGSDLQVSAVNAGEAKNDIWWCRPLIGPLAVEATR